MAIPAHLTIVTVGVSDLDRSIAFYRALGWEQRGDPAHGIVWFRTSGSWLGLFPDAELAADVGVDAPSTAPPYRGVTLAINTNSEAEVDAMFAAVGDVIAEHGGRIVKPAERAEWGGYRGYFADPDGHLWEIAHGADFVVDESGRIDIP